MQIEMILQGKGGVGKTLIASLLAQHYKSMGVKTLCIDTDPVTPAFSGLKAYGVRHLDLMDGDDVDPGGFDEMMEMITEADGPRAAVIDNGGSSFVPLCAFLKEGGAVPWLEERGHKVRFHTVVTGGASELYTTRCFNDLCENFPDVKVAVWLNEFFGRVGEMSGKGFEETPVFKKHKDRVTRMITLPAVRPQTLGRDIEEMRSRGLSFDEAANHPKLKAYSRQRLVMYWRNMDGRMKAAELWGREEKARAAARPVVVKEQGAAS